MDPTSKAITGAGNHTRSGDHWALNLTQVIETPMTTAKKTIGSNTALNNVWNLDVFIFSFR